MKTRTEIRERIYAIENELIALNKERITLIIESFKLCDSEQTYEEKEEVFIIKKRPLIKGKRLIGRIHFSELFKDESTGEKFPIKRCPIVRINDEWFFSDYRHKNYDL